MSDKLLKSNFKDIYSECTTENDYYSLNQAYIVNSFVVIRGTIKKSISGTYMKNMIPQRYAPYKNAYGLMTYRNGGNDVGQVPIVELNTSGQLYVWIQKALTGDCQFQLMYPLKID